jgi:HPt (histidine-containing phosphotransfer) domain-containing protein
MNEQSTDVHPQLEYVYSELADDPELRDLIQLFVDEMPYRAALYEELFRSGDFDELRRAIHQLKGAAGSYGFSVITEAAATLEQSIRHEAPYEQIRHELHGLIRLCTAARIAPSQ